MKKIKVCKKCKALVESNVGECPVCHSKEFGENPKGMIIVLDPKNSEIAKKLGIEKEGKYAVKV